VSRNAWVKSKKARKAAWLARYEDLLVAGVPELAGRVDWNTALYYYYQELTPEQASARAIKAHKPEEAGQ
jgi:hypothetical protein